MQANEWFRLWFSSPYYDILYKKRDTEEAVKFIDALVTYLEIPQHSFMLDAACGKGRHSIALAAKGFDVTGIDICVPAITEAKKHESENLHFYLHDMRLPFYINYFNYAFNFFTSFGYFRTMREHNDAMRTIAQSLKPTGVFTIDYLNTYYTEKNLKPSDTIETDNVLFEIKRWFDDVYFYKSIDVIDKEKNVNENFTERVEKFQLDDFTTMLSLQGLQIEDVFGDYDLHSYNEKESARMIIIAGKVL
jgi:SAM-dependent methyltransferase